MRSSSLQELIAAGVGSPRTYRDLLIHEWHLAEWERNIVQAYFLAKEDTEVLKQKIHNGVFKLDNKDYHITWIHRPETVYKAPFALLSFRYCSYLRCGYVLIKALDADSAPDFLYVEYKDD